MQDSTLLAGFITSMAISLVAIPSIVKVARSKKLYSTAREGGPTGIPTLGGLAIFAAVIVSLNLFADRSILPELHYLTAGAVILFFIGLKDDILLIAPWWKLLGQVLVALLITVPCGLRIHAPGAQLGIHLEGEAWEILITVLAMVVVINSINLIDGIDGLAAGIGMLASLMFGMVFYHSGPQAWVLLPAALFGGLAGFSWYNVFSRRKKIHMGDTGSLLLGFLLALMLIHFLNLEQTDILAWKIHTPLAFAVAVLIVPLFDTLRIVVVRILKGRSPLRPDRHHIHYRLVDAGLTHIQATGLLLLVNLAMVFIALGLQGFGEIPVLVLLITLSTLFSLIPGWLIRRRK